MRKLEPFAIPLAGINLIEASAGTGKTYNIASLYVRALVEREIEVDDILVVTYTEAATKELRERLMHRLRESVQSLQGKEFSDHEFLRDLPARVKEPNKAIEKLRKAIRSFDQAAIYTIHGFCYHALQEQAFESRALFDAELIGDDTEIVREVIDDLWRKWVEEASNNRFKRPLLKYLMDKGYHPDKLTGELSGFVGKPYLEIRPEESSGADMEASLQRLSKLYQQLRDEWQRSREGIFRLLDAGHLSYYRTDWLQGWMIQMQEWLDGEVPPIELFDKFDRFVQSYIDDSLKKGSKKKGVTSPQHPFFKLADDYKSVAAELRDFEISFKLDLFSELVQLLDIRKEELQILSYDDLLIRLRDALVDAGRGRSLAKKIRKAFPIALVDEFQDTDPVQYQIFRTIYRDASDDSALFMIGDPKQSIYSFRGADIFAYLKAKRDAPPDQTYSLGRNFRSVPELIGAVNRIFTYYCKNPFILENITFHPVEPGRKTEAYRKLLIDEESTKVVEFRNLNDSLEELPATKGDAQQYAARDTAYEIAKLLKKAADGNAQIGGRKVEASDIAVLVRSHYQAGLVRDALREVGISSVQYSQDSVFDSREAEELQFILKAVAEPTNEGLVRSALATKIMSYQADDLLRLEEDEAGWSAKLEQFSEWHDLWQNKGFAYMFRQLMQDENIAEKLIRRQAGERKLTNLVHLSELLQEEERNGKAGTRSLIQWVARKQNEDRREQEEEQLRLESDENLVRVVTMHRSKGLEYPIVFCPFLWHGTEYGDAGNPIVYHDTEEPSRVYLDFNGKSDPERNRKRFKMAQEDLAESLRLAYVAITRAEQKCIITWIQAQKCEYSPLGYLLLGQDRSFRALEATISSESSYSSLEPHIFMNSLDELIAGHSNLFAITGVSEPQRQQLSLIGEDSSRIECRSFQRKGELSAGFSLSSFSSLTRNKEADFEIEYDLYGEDVAAVEGDSERKTGEEEPDMFNFPKGPNPGTAIHHIFEEIDFARPEKLAEVVDEQLKRHDIDSRWSKTVAGMVKKALNKNLSPKGAGIKLADLGQQDLVPEMEFYFSSGEVQLSDLLEIIRPEEKIPQFAGNYAEAGYLKGYIDLTFRHNGKYYILDYKTNHLGNTSADYAYKQLQYEMKEALYDLQYHLYVLALHRYLQEVQPAYSYDTHFGGVFYLFLRGINTAGKEGIYFDKPEKSLIQKLDNYFERRDVHG